MPPYEYPNHAGFATGPFRIRANLEPDLDGIILTSYSKPPASLRAGNLHTHIQPYSGRY